MSQNIQIRRPADINEMTPWQEMTIGGEIAEPATSALTMTGEWRSNRPVYIPENCKQCLLCAPFCPDSSIPVTDGKREDFDYGHCKGCGICYKICPFSAIAFVKEPDTVRSREADEITGSASERFTSDVKMAFIEEGEQA